MGKQVEEKVVETIEVKGQETAASQETAVKDIVETKKKGFWKSLGTGAKITLGVITTGVVVVGGLVIKSLLGGKGDEADENSADAEPETEEPAEE